MPDVNSIALYCLLFLLLLLLLLLFIIIYYYCLVLLAFFSCANILRYCGLSVG